MSFLNEGGDLSYDLLGSFFKRVWLRMSVSVYWEQEWQESQSEMPPGRIFSGYF